MDIKLNTQQSTNVYRQGFTNQHQIFMSLPINGAPRGAPDGVPLITLETSRRPEPVRIHPTGTPLVMSTVCELENGHRTSSYTH